MGAGVFGRRQGRGFVFLHVAERGLTLLIFVVFVLRWLVLFFLFVGFFLLWVFWFFGLVLFVGLFLILIFLILVFLILFVLLVLLIFVVLLLLILFLLLGFFQEGGEFFAELGPVGGFRVELRAGVDGGEGVADGALGDGLLFGLEAAAPRDGFAAEFGPVAGGAGFGGGDATDDFGEGVGRRGRCGRGGR